MLTEEIVKTVEFDDILRAHVQVISDSISILHEDLYKEFHRKYGINSVVFLVMENEISRMVQVITEEVARRRQVCRGNSVSRVSDLALSDLSENDRNTVQRLFLHILLPKSERIRNMESLKRLMHACRPLDIHFVVYQAPDSKPQFLEMMKDITCWEIDDVEGTIIDRSNTK